VHLSSQRDNEYIKRRPADAGLLFDITQARRACVVRSVASYYIRSDNKPPACYPGSCSNSSQRDKVLLRIQKNRNGVCKLACNTPFLFFCIHKNLREWSRILSMRSMLFCVAEEMRERYLRFAIMKKNLNIGCVCGNNRWYYF